MFSRPNIVISKCINFDSCRYNGDIVEYEFAKKLGGYVNFIPVCPEVAIGLGIPRDPVRLIEGKENEDLYQPSTGLYLTKKMEDFAESFFAKNINIDGFLMKNRSPSCGIKDIKVYNGADGNMSSRKDAKGIFTRNIEKYHSGIPIEDEGRLRNYKLRENYLIKIFCIAEFREIRKTLDISKLIEFHSKNKFLFKCYSQNISKYMGGLLGGHKGSNYIEIFDLYELNLYKLFSKNYRKSNLVNSLMHIQGFFKKDLSHAEKKLFLDSVDKLNKNLISSKHLIDILYSWAVRFGDKYILSQTIFNPFPEELLELDVSGKKLDI